jgi:hypothetical protein
MDERQSTNIRLRLCFAIRIIINVRRASHVHDDGAEKGTERLCPVSEESSIQLD